MSNILSFFRIIFIALIYMYVCTQSFYTQMRTRRMQKKL